MSPRHIPSNVVADETAYVDPYFGFRAFVSEAEVGLRIGRGATCAGTMFNVGRRGRVTVGDYVMLIAARIVCDAVVEIGDYSMVAWDAIVMDSYGVPFDLADRRRELQRVGLREPRRLDFAAYARPIRIGRGVWIGTGACVLPGVVIGDGSVVGARAVVGEDVPAYTVVAGNPARVVRRLPPAEVEKFKKVLYELGNARP
jgi:acetyltransferase-like isoleucine patch superfamily enzyme